MADPVTFYRSYVNEIKTLIDQLETLRTMNDRMTEDLSLAAAASGAAASSGRPDLTTQAFNNAHGAIVQLLFAFDSGEPTQKSYLYNML